MKIAKATVRLNKIIDSWKLETKIPIVKSILLYYNFDGKIPEMEKRFNNYKTINARSQLIE